MPKITVYLNDDIFQDLKNISDSFNKSISKTSSELMEFGIKKYQNAKQDNIKANDTNQMKPYEKKHFIHSLVIQNFVIEILKKLKNEPSFFDSKDVMHTVSTIKRMAADTIKNV
jgi:hypothetical protein